MGIMEAVLYSAKQEAFDEGVKIGIEKGIKISIEKGVKIGIILVIKEILQKGYSIEFVADTLDLEIEYVTSIHKTIKTGNSHNHYKKGIL